MGSKLDWSHKAKIWELHHLQKTPIDQIRAKFRTRRDGVVPSWSTVQSVVKEFASLSEAQARQLPDALRRRWQELRPEAGQDKPKGPPTEQEPYIETAHKLRMRQLAKALAGEIDIPTFWNKDLWRDLPVEFREGRYSLSIGEVQIGQDRQIKVKYSDIGAGVATPHLVRGLFSHLSTSGSPRFMELVGDNGKLNSLTADIEQHSHVILAFLKLLVNEVEGYGVRVNFHDEAEPGLTKWFITAAWLYILWRAIGYTGIDESMYKPHESIPGTDLWQVRCGAYSIGIARDKTTLGVYERWHKDLRVTHAENPLAKDMAGKYKGLNMTAQDIKQRLQEFSDMERLPGQCELCQFSGRPKRT